MSVSKIEKNCAYHDDVTKATLCVSDIRDNIVYFFSVKNDGFRGYVSSIQHDDALNRFSLLGAYSLKSTGIDSLEYMWEVMIEDA